MKGAMKKSAIKKQMEDATRNKTWWYCPHNPKGLKCSETTKACKRPRTSRDIEKDERHNTSHVADRRDMSQIEIKTLRTNDIITEVVRGNKFQLSIPHRVVRDAGHGFQGLAAKRIGGLRLLGGIMADVDRTAVLFTLPRQFRPNYDSSFLVPMVEATNAKRNMSAVATV